MEEKRVAVTGATGFVGRHAVSALLAAGWEVFALCRQPDAEAGGARVVEWHAGQPAELEPLGLKAVVNLAAFIPTDYGDPTQARSCLEVNALGTLRLLQDCEAAGVRRFVQVSSGNVYTPSSALVDENAPTLPGARASFYLSSKLCADIYVEAFRAQRGMLTCTLRVSSVYGPGMAPKGLIPQLTKRMLERKRVVIENGGRYAVDLVCVNDVADCIASALNAQVTGTFNIGSGRRDTVRDIAAILAELANYPTQQMVLEPAENERELSGFSGLNIERARDLLEFEPTQPREGLAGYLKSLRLRPAHETDF